MYTMLHNANSQEFTPHHNTHSTQTGWQAHIMNIMYYQATNWLIKSADRTVHTHSHHPADHTADTPNILYTDTRKLHKHQDKWINSRTRRLGTA